MYNKLDRYIKKNNWKNWNWKIRGARSLNHSSKKLIINEIRH